MALERLGLAEQNAVQSGFGSASWHLRAACMISWLINDPNVGLRPPIEFESWLRDQDSELLLNRGQQDGLKKLIGRVLVEAWKSAAEIVLKVIRSTTGMA